MRLLWQAGGGARYFRAGLLSGRPGERRKLLARKIKREPQAIKRASGTLRFFGFVMRTAKRAAIDIQGTQDPESPQPSDPLLHVQSRKQAFQAF
jgi:hypothetical protein